ncbi:MAG: alpha-amylase family glycosyl hydrolase [Treponema sp.]|nr:alpha-amylase family glycosyl hydrolase [Treponema sp.]
MMGSKIQKVISGSILSAVLLFASCSTTGKQVKEPQPGLAVNQLAPVVRSADTPSEGVYYCIFVRSFADSNGDGIGDFNGITKKLDYLNDGNDLTTSDLGVTGIWLLPIYPSQSYHGYDVDDYYSTNPDYGTMEDFQNLVNECKKRGISVILDMTCNHSSIYNQWFIDSRNPDDPHRTWYRWISADDPQYSINQQIWGHRVWNQYKGYYYAGIFASNMPDFNLDDPALRQEFKNVMKFWLDKGVAGFRYDAAGHVYNSAKTPAGTNSVEKGVAWWKEITAYDRSVRPDAYTVGEVWEPTSTRAQYMAGLGSDFHFDLGTKIVDEVRSGNAGNNSFANGLQGEYERYSESNPDYIDAPFLSNHDQNRVAGLLRGQVPQLKLAAAMYIFAEGVPFIYYGEEIGMMGGKPDEQLRTPMMWNKPGKDKLQATWETSRYNKKTLTVAEQTKDSGSLLQFYKRIIRIKTAHPALYKGRFKAVNTGSEFISSWAMECDTEKALVLHNLSPDSVTVQTPAGYNNLPMVFTTYSGSAVNSDGQISIPPFCSVVLAGSK